MSIRIKAIVFFFLLASLAMLLMMGFSTTAVESVLIQELEKRGVSTALALVQSQTTLQGFRSEDEKQLLPQLQMLMKHTEALYAIALNPKGTVVAHVNITEKGKTYRDPVTLEAIVSDQPVVQRHTFEEKPVLDVAVPVHDYDQAVSGEDFLLLSQTELKDKARIGTLRLGVPLAGSLETARRISKQLFWIIVGVNCIGLALTIFFVQKIASPISQLAEGTKKIGRGELGVQVPVQGKDEIAGLAESFNQMSQTLAETTVSKAFLDSILKNMQDAVVVTTSDLRIRMINQTALNLLGYDEETLIGASVLTLFDEQEWHPNPFELRGRVRRGLTRNLDLHFVAKSGRKIPILLSVSQLEVAEDAFVGYVFTAQDITERKAAEEKVRKSEMLLAEAQQIARLGSWEWDVSTDTVTWSRELYRIFGLTPKTFTPTYQGFLDQVHPSDVEKANASVERSLRTGELLNYHFRIIRPDGEIRTLHARGRAIKDEKGQVLKMFGTAQDVTEIIEAQEALKASEEKYRTILETIEDGYYEVDLAGNFTFFNDAICRILGYSPDELMGMNNRAYTDEFNAKKLYETFNRVFRTGKPEKGFDWAMIRKDGEVRTVEASTTLIRSPDGEAIGFRGIVRDVTERKKLEAQLRQAQKMETIGRLTGGIAHDFNNLLTVILGNVEFGLQDSQAGDAVHEDFQEIEQAATQARDLVRQLLSFSRRQEIKPEPLDINAVVEQFLKMQRRILGEHIESRTELRPNLPSVWVDPVQIQQVLMNLCVNARDAMPEGGCLTIKTDCVKGAAIADLTDEGDADREYVQITVEDTGTGMDDQTQARIFEPFFSTKAVGEGTGLGLSVVFGIIRQHQGHIEVQSAPGQGTRVHIYLPVRSKTPEKATDRERKPEQTEGHETILLVEDEDNVRRVAIRILEQLGYDVMTASDGRHAIEVFEKHHPHVDLVIMDMVMPNMGGAEAIQRIRQLAPNLPFLLITGYDASTEMDEVLTGDGRVAVLFKPFDRPSLAKKIRELLDRDA